MASPGQMVVLAGLLEMEIVGTTVGKAMTAELAAGLLQLPDVITTE